MAKIHEATIQRKFAARFFMSTIRGYAGPQPRYPDADLFDIMRHRSYHLAFRQGTFTCVGMHLAQFET